MRLSPSPWDADENLAAYTLALERFDETREIIRDAQARKSTMTNSTVLSTHLPFSRQTRRRWRNSNSGMQVSPSTNTKA